MKKKINFFLLKIIILSVLLLSCTLSGMEISLVGNWTITGLKSDKYEVSLIDDGSLKISNKDELEYDFKYKMFNLSYSAHSVYKILNSDYNSKTIELMFGDSSSIEDPVKWKYVLNGDYLDLDTRDFILKCSKIK